MKQALILGLLLLMSSNLRAEGCVSDASLKKLKSCGRDLTILTGFALPSPTTMIAMEFEEYLNKLEVRPLVLQKTGASGNIAADELVRAKNSDCTFFLSSSVNYFVNQHNPNLKPNIDPAKEFKPIGLIARMPMLIAVNSKRMKVEDLNGFVDELQSKDTKYATPGIGTLPHLVGTMIGQKLKLSDGLSSDIPSRIEQMPQMLARGDVDYQFVFPSDLAIYKAYPQVKIIGTTSHKVEQVEGEPKQPASSHPKLKGLEAMSAMGMVANSRASSEATGAMENALKCFVASEKFKTKWSGLGYEVSSGAAKDLKDLMAKETGAWAPVAKRVLAPETGAGAAAAPTTAAPASHPAAR
jgi:tripartite-type tricarboxylate transporter receptor subunit TctC